MECRFDTFVPVFGYGGQFFASILGGGSAVIYPFLRCIKVKNNIAVVYDSTDFVQIYGNVGELCVEIGKVTGMEFIA